MKIVEIQGKMLEKREKIPQRTRTKVLLDLAENSEQKTIKQGGKQTSSPQ
jgi:hypothetical protein